MRPSVQTSITKLSSVFIAGFAVAGFLFPEFGRASYYNMNFGFKPVGSPKLAFTTSAQSLATGLCSGVATVQSQNANGTARNVGSNLTVNLTGVGTMTFYSDAACSTSITSVTITTGSNTSSFYFIDSATGSHGVTAAATGYTNGSQTETISTNNFVWTGGGANSLWATGGNWSGGSQPGTSDVALFNSTCSSNCSPTLGANISIGGLRMETGYGGTFTQSGSYTITTSTGGWVQKAGTFVGSSSGGGITIGGNFALTGGAFTSTSGTLSHYRTGGSLDFKVTGSPTFTHNSGTISFDSSGYVAHTLTPGAVTYYNVTFTGYADTHNLGGGTMTVAGDLTVNAAVNNGTVAIGGNLTGGIYSAQASTSTMKLTGKAAGQTLSVASGGYLCNVELATGTNPVTFSGTLALAGNFTVTSVGTATMTGSTLNFAGTGFATASIKPGSITYNDVRFGSYAASFDFTGGTMTIGGNLTIGIGTGNSNDGGTFNNGTLAVTGNVTTNASQFVQGTALVKLTGNASGQTVTSNSYAATTTRAGVPNLEIATGANNVTFSGAVRIGRNYTMTSVGTLTTTGSSVYFESDQSTATITVGTETFNDVYFYDPWGGMTYTLSGTLKVGGNFVMGKNGYFMKINGGTLSLSKNFTSTGHSSNGGTTAVTFVGTADQTVTSTGGGTFPSGAITLSTTGSNKLLLGSAVTFAGTLTETSGGGITMGGYAFTLGGLALGGKTITKGGGTLVVNGTTVGTGSLYGGTVNP